MKFSEFKETDFAGRILEGLTQLKKKYGFGYKPEDMLIAVYYSFLNIDGTLLNESNRENIEYYVINHDDVLKYIMTEYFGVAEPDYRLWSNKIYNKSTSMLLSDPIGLLTATYKSNRNKIH